MDRVTCRSLETRFLERFERHIRELKLLHSPLTFSAFEVSGALRHTASEEVEMKAAVRRYVPAEEQPQAYDEMPRNRMLVLQIMQRRLLGPSRPRVAAAAASISPLEELARSGRASRPAGPEEIERVLKRLLTQRRIFTYVLLFSPTGWSREARGHLLGSHYAIGLVDPFGTGLRVYPPPESRVHTRRAFDLTPYPEKFQMLRDLMDRRTVELVLGDFSEDLVAEELYFSREAIENLFVDAVREDEFLILDARNRPIRLLREYSRPSFPSPKPVPEESELLRYRDASERDHARIQCILKDIGVLAREEDRVLNEGARAPLHRRKLLAHRLRRIRHRRRDLETRLEVFQKRYRITAAYVATLEEIRAAKTESVPDEEKLEEMLARARVERERVQQLSELARAGRDLEEPVSSPADIDSILKELEPKSPPVKAEERPADAGREKPGREPVGEKPPKTEPEEPEEGMLLESE